MSVELYPHQQKAVNKMHNGCVLTGDVGTGKTITSLFYYFTKVCKGVVGDVSSMRDPKRVIVITTAKKRDVFDWQRDAAMMGIFERPEDNPHHISITVDSWNNVTKYEEVEDAFFIFDEQRLVGAGAWTKAFVKIAKSNEWVLLSATPGDTWLDYIPVFIANGFYKNRTEFKRRHVVYNNFAKFPKVDRYVEVGHLVRLRSSILVEMPYERHTKRHLIETQVSYDETLFKRVMEDRWHVYEDRPLRDVAELFSVMRKVVNSDNSRLAAIRELMSKHPKLIVFYNFDYELEQLRTLVPKGQLASPESIEQLAERLSSEERIGRERRASSGRKPLSRSSTSSTSKTSSPSSRKSDAQLTSSNATDTGAASRTTGSARNLSRLTVVKDAPVLDAKLPLGLPPSLIESPSLGAWDRFTDPEIETDCEGHWSEDEGDGEFFFHCEGGVCWVPNGEFTEGGDATGDWESFAVAEWNGHKHEEIPDTDRWVYLVQYTSGAEGWNCVETDAMVFYSLTYSYRAFYQCQGRIDRLNTPFVDLKYYVLRSLSIIDKMIVKSLKSKESFNEAKSSLGSKFKEAA